MTPSRGHRPSTAHTGALAEAAALLHLEGQGLRLVRRNYRCRCGELDLVMTDGPTLVIVEVRYRASAALVEPALTVTWRKRHRLLRATRRFLQEHPHHAGNGLRFDVMSLSGPLPRPRCRWYRGAFTADDLDGG